jgi:Flp pilus assembly protein TadB
MNEILDFFGRLVRGVFRLALGLAALVFVLSLLLATLVLVLALSLWALVTGRKPTPSVVFTRFRQTSQRYTQGMWPPGGAGRPMGDVVDVQATEVPEPVEAPQRRNGADPMARVIH